jgi:hypothetical protein
MFHHCRFPAEKSSDPLGDTYNTAQEVTITNMQVSYLCPTFTLICLIQDRGLFPFYTNVILMYVFIGRANVVQERKWDPATGKIIRKWNQEQLELEDENRNLYEKEM